MFWKVSYELFVQKEHFCDSVVAEIGRNDFYKTVNDMVFSAVDLPPTKDDVLNGLVIKQSTVENADNGGNAATVDVKYFTKYLRGVGVHITPTISIDGIVVPLVSSSTSLEELMELFKSYL